MTSVPELRIRHGNRSLPNPEGDFVLYWMTAHRRLGWNFALQHATDLAREYRKPLIILETLSRFVSRRLSRYAEDRNHPDLAATSGLSPYLHFGLVSTHEVFSEVASSEGWTPLRLSERTDGARAGWWGMGQGAEAFQEAGTHDPLWNAAQRQLLRDGIIHNYLRMLWGKKNLEWTPSAREALEIMISLNDRFAMDGRDPNSCSGIFWCLGRYDRGWPERPVFGKVRSMSSEATKRKSNIAKYLETFSSSEL